MRKLVKKFGIVIMLLAILPIPAVIHLIGLIIGLDSELILIYQLPGLIVQLICLAIMVRYRDEIF